MIGGHPLRDNLAAGQGLQAVDALPLLGVQAVGDLRMGAHQHLVAGGRGGRLGLDLAEDLGITNEEAERFLEDSGCRWVAKPFRLKELVRIARESLG